MKLFLSFSLFVTVLCLDGQIPFRLEDFRSCRNASSTETAVHFVNIHVNKSGGQKSRHVSPHEYLCFGCAPIHTNDCFIVERTAVWIPDNGCRNDRVVQSCHRRIHLAVEKCVASQKQFLSRIVSYCCNFQVAKFNLYQVSIQIFFETTPQPQQPQKVYAHFN